jgi:alpha-L-fucosidase
MDRNGGSIYGTEPCEVPGGNYWSATRRGNTLYAHVHFWPGTTVVLAGLRNKVLSAKFLATGRPVEFKQDELRVLLTGLPARPPDDPVTSFALELDSEPRQDRLYIRTERKRAGV